MNGFIDQAVDSSSLRRIVYSERVAALWVRFSSGTVYRYDGVPAAVVQQLLAAHSHGRFFAQHVRQPFGCTAVSDDLDEVAKHMQDVDRGQRFVLELPMPYTRQPFGGRAMAF